MAKTYLYKGKLYSSEWWKDHTDKYAGSLGDLVDLLAEDKTNDLEVCTQVYYTLGGDFYATEDDIDCEELIEYMIDGGYTELVEEANE